MGIGMTTRITLHDLQRALESHTRALQRCGITYDGTLRLEPGSATYGRAFRLYLMPPGTTALWSPPIGSDYLGMTKAEAYDNLVTRTQLIYDIHAAITEEES